MQTLGQALAGLRACHGQLLTNTNTNRQQVMSTYKIVRFFHPSQDRNNQTMEKGLTLEQAQAHCKDPATRKDGVYFDGYTEEQ